MSWPDGKPRFIIREISGFNIDPRTNSVGSAGNKEVTDVMILDRAYCHRVVHNYKANRNGQPRLYARRALAEHRAALLNAEDTE